MLDGCAQISNCFLIQVIDLLIRSGRFYQLHQFLQYHVIGDSVHVACQLLAVEKSYPPAYQLALDMLKRLSNPHNNVKDQIVEVLLARKQVTHHTQREKKRERERERREDVLWALKDHRAHPLLLHPTCMVSDKPWWHE